MAGRREGLRIRLDDPVKPKATKTNAQRCKEYRESMKSDPVKYASYRLKCMERSRIYNHRKLSDEEKARCRERDRLRQQKYRERKAAAAKKNPSLTPSKPLTRKDKKKATEMKKRNKLSHHKKASFTIPVTVGVPFSIPEEPEVVWEVTEVEKCEASPTVDTVDVSIINGAANDSFSADNPVTSVSASPVHGPSESTPQRPSAQKCYGGFSAKKQREDIQPTYGDLLKIEISHAELEKEQLRLEIENLKSEKQKLETDLSRQKKEQELFDLKLENKERKKRLQIMQEELLELKLLKLRNIW